jgi:hypothetical protein
MSTLSVRLPNSLHQQLRECAKREGISINQLISSAVAEKMSAILTEEYLANRGKRGNRKKFEKALKSVPNVQPDEFDRIPERRPRRRGRP